jgi:hypothetical protein
MKSGWYFEEKMLHKLRPEVNGRLTGEYVEFILPITPQVGIMHKEIT